MNLSGLCLPRLAAGLTLLASLALSLGARELLPVETFFDDNSIRQMTLSPDGNKIAMIAPNIGRYSIALLDTTNGKTSVVVHFKDENIRSVFWKGNDRLLFTSAVEGHEIPLLASADLQGKSVKRILEPRRRVDDFSLFFGKLEDSFPVSDDHILILGFTAESEPAKFTPSVPRNPTASIYKVNVESARRLQITAVDDGLEQSFYDREANMRLAVFVEGDEMTVRSRTANGKSWHVIKKLNLDAATWNILELSQDGTTAYLIDYEGNDRGALRTLDIDTGRLGAPIFAPAAGEITGLIFDRSRTRLLGVAYEDDKERVHWLDEKWEGIVAALEQGLAGQTVQLVSLSLDEKRFLFRTHSDRSPGVYYLGDLRGKGLQVQPLSAVRPAIKSELMREMEVVNFTARDGLPLQGYLTRPAQAAEEKMPLIVLPHGGPWARDSWGFNSEVQFLANRGYAVLQINFRGSTGYGVRFLDAGDREWGRKMQNDLSDGVKWAIEQGFADPKRVGIMGASYGGYAALAGVTFTPELYCVGVNYVGVADLRLITRYDLAQGYASKRSYSKRVGEGEAFFAERSPIDHVASIRVPTFHAYGRNDPRVKIEHWEGLEAQLKKHNKVYQVHLEDGEGHGFEKAEAAIKLYRAVDAFLAEHLRSPRPTVEPGPVRVVEMPAKEKN